MGSKLSRERRRLSGQLFEDQTFTNEDVRNGLADQAGFKNCTFVDCEFANASLGGAALIGCKFTGCDFRGAVMVARIYDCEFTDCDLDQATFGGAHVRGTRFTRCRFQYTDWTRATVEQTSFLRCSMHGARLDMAVSRGLDFSGSNLWGALIPLGCAMFVDNRFDRRQLHMLLALLQRIDGPDAVATVRAVRPLIDPKTLKLVDRLVDGEAANNGGI